MTKCVTSFTNDPLVILKCKIVDNNNIGLDKVDVFHSRDLDSRPSDRESHMAPVLGKGTPVMKKRKDLCREWILNFFLFFVDPQKLNLTY